jgi:peptidoglycan hydrolase-like protein with peptidoglycan-binding domain
MRRTLLITGAAAVILGGAIGGAALARGPAPEKPKAKLPAATAKVSSTTLVETKTVSGTLGYGDRVPIRATETGTLTWISPVGSTVERGKPLFKVDERPVVALYGSLPLYRTLRMGIKGADVQQLEQNLAELGYSGLAVDDTYTTATAKVVRTWQGDLGLPQSGTIEPGQVVFTPGAVRIAEHTARVGDTIGSGSREDTSSVLSYTGTTRLVTVDIGVADRTLAIEGRTVTVTIPGAGAVEGKISEIGTVATAKAEASPAPGRGSAAPSNTSSAASDARIQVTVTIADQKALGSLDAAPVNVDLVSEERKDVLAVPVTALLALAAGGFGVEIVDGDTTRIVAVNTGMFAAGRVEVSGKGIAEGVTVGVAK